MAEVLWGGCRLHSKERKWKGREGRGKRRQGTARQKSLPGTCQLGAIIQHPENHPECQGEANEALQPLAPPSTTCALPLLSAIQQEVGAAPSGWASCNTCNTSAWGKYDRHSSPLTPSPPPPASLLPSHFPTINQEVGAPPVRGFGGTI